MPAGVHGPSHVAVNMPSTVQQAPQTSAGAEEGHRGAGIHAGRAYRATVAAVSLVTLVVQNAMLVLMTRYAKSSAVPGRGFHTSTVVLNQEVMKLVVCLGLLAWEREVKTPSEYIRVFRTVVWQPECVKLALPAGLFTLQNFLIFASLGSLDVMTFQILSQTKLLSAALFSVSLLGRTLSRGQWGSLVLLCCGVILAQTQAAPTTSVKGAAGHATSPTSGAAGSGSAFMGALACIVSGLSSSFAGVYFEKVVKTTAPSLAVRNIHLSIFGIPFAAGSMLVLDVWGSFDSTFHYFQGYSWFTWCLVAIHALGGLLVATVVKYADNILKGFATAVAIIVSGVFAALFWGYSPAASFVGGCALVIVSIVWFQVAEEKKPDC